MSDLPVIIEHLFTKYKRRFEDPENRIEANSPLKNYKEFFTDLHIFFGNVLVEALRILDSKRPIIIYTTEATSRRQLAELHLSGKVIKLHPRVNFCFCDYFRRHVLQLPDDSWMTSSGNVRPTNKIQSYTCEHVLALRLAQLLRVPELHEEQLPKEKFNLLLSQMRG